MAQPSYMQFCAVARALDAVGERWTLLIVRELLIGPRRYTDLLAGLPGVSPNVLAERLKKLEELDLVTRRRLPPPAPASVYELTELGRTLEPVLRELLRWGLNLLTERRPGETVRLDHVLLAFELAADPAASRGIEESYEFHVEGETFHVAAADGRLSFETGAAQAPAAVFTTDFETLIALGAGRKTPPQAQAEGRFEVEGDPGAAARAGLILAPAMARAAAVAAAR